MKMRKNIISLAILAAFGSVAKSDDGSDESLANLVKMCLFYGGPSGHARSDPILSQTCASDHVHTFYGPQNFHPDTTYEDIRDSSPQFSSTPTVENQSLYWHPSIYQVSTDASGAKTYNRVNNLETSPYYRWDTTLLPAVEAFPPGFRMIAYSNENLLVECCNMIGEEESCTEQDGNLNFPSQNCDFVGIAFAMPTCWNGNLGIDNDHINHMAYTMNGGGVAGECPDGYDRRLPEIQLFVRIPNYQGATFEYTLSDESNVFHVDFMNGWEEGKLQEIINNCPVTGNGNDGYNPPCGCDEFLTPNNNVAGPVCDSDTKNLIVNEDTDVVNVLPRGTCQGASLVPKSWDLDPPLECTNPSPSPPSEDEDDDESCCKHSMQTYIVFSLVLTIGVSILSLC